MFSWLVYAGLLFYFETVFHLACFGLHGGNPVFLAGLVTLIAAVQALIGGSLPQKAGRAAFWVMALSEYLIYAVQAVYFHVFRQPLQLTAVFMGGQDALTDYWREALTGLRETLPLLLLLALPLIGAAAAGRLKKWGFKSLQGIQKLRMGLLAWAGLLYSVCCIIIGDTLQADYAEEYLEFYAPSAVMERLGVLAMVQRDGFYEIENLAARLSDRSAAMPEEKEDGLAVGQGEDEAVLKTSKPQNGQEDEPVEQTDADPMENLIQEGEDAEPETEEPDTSPHVWELDMEKLAELSGDNKEKVWLADYIAGLTPTNRNEYTGLFEGYNLIFLTAEGFSTYAVREDLTPTLYRLINSSFVFSNYYVPLWQTSTSDGEYVNCTGLIPDGQFSMRKSSSNNMAYTLPRFFAGEGVYSWAYHDNTLSYYDRQLSHPNLGYDYKASKLGELSEEEWGEWIFPMENPMAWPASDYEMMQGTVPEYINADRFHVYYMTVSGHMNYNFKGNQMALRNREAVQELDMSENAQAYIACNIELDKALAYLLEQLEQAGKLQNTVICLSADHYPYGMTMEQYEELAGKDLSNGKDLYRNSLILWNAAMEEPVTVDKACCSVDLLPTLLNLFGFDYDSRMYAGRDIFSEEEGLVIFNDQSFVSDTAEYNRKDKTVIWKKELSEEEQKEYLDMKKQDVKNRYLFSAYILRNDYYDIVSRCVVKR